MKSNFLKWSMLCFGIMALTAGASAQAPRTRRIHLDGPWMQTSAAGSVGQTPGQLEAQRSDDLKIARMFVEVAGGYVLGLAGAQVGGLIGALSGCISGAASGGTASSTAQGCTTGLIVGATAGELFLAPAGVTLVGNWMRGRGNYWGALLGSLAGSAAMLGGGLALSFANVDRGAFEAIMWGLIALPAIGSMLGYEIQGDMNNEEIRHQGVAVVPTAAPLMASNGRVDGVMVGASVSNF